MDIEKQLNSASLSEAFNFTREKNEAMHGLKGILIGIVADRQLNEKELLFLDAWLQSQKYLSDDKDVVSILTRVGDILENGHISPGELEKMQAQIEEIASERATPISDRVGQLDELIGFVTGIASDGVLNDDEIHALSTWLQGNVSIHNMWPASIIVDRVSGVLAGGKIRDEERAELLAVINRITGGSTKVVFEVASEVWEDPIDRLEFAGKTYSLTGDFVNGNRDAIESFLHGLGAKTHSNVNRDVDYLVIGTLASHDWLYGTHGRKIEKALLLKREGENIKILTERTLLKHARKVTQAS